MSFSRFHRRDRSVDDVAQPAPSSELSHRSAVLGDEVDAFLGGRMVEHLVEAGQVVPAWTVLNKVAHATVEELVGLARPGDGSGSSAPGGRGEPVWLCAQRSLAAELLDGAATPDDVVGAQRAVLVPLELWLIERSKAEMITSRRGAEMASDMLAAHRRGR